MASKLRIVSLALHYLLIWRKKVLRRRKQRPENTPFKQQKLRAWQPLITPGTIIPTCFGIGLAFIPIGVGMLWFSNSTMEKVITYTDCQNSDGQVCKDVIGNKRIMERNCTCTVPFEIEEVWTGGQVYIYYSLINFYQNHRRYVKSRDDGQLYRKYDQGYSNVTTAANCEPLYACSSVEECCNGADGSSGAGCGNALKNNTPFLPCGAVANSLFSDVITLKYVWTNSILLANINNMK